MRLLLLVLPACVLLGGDAGSALATAGDPPVNVTPPAVAGIAQDGQTLTAIDGEWTGTPPITYDYRWRRCDTTGENCITVSGARDPAYTLTHDDVGATLRVRVIATNAYGTAYRSSLPTPVVAPAPPVSTAQPVVSGIAREGQTLTTTDGEWTGTPPIAYEYRWRRCDARGQNCVTISDARDAGYTLTADDIGATVRARVIATNVAGVGYRSSAATAVVGAAWTGICGNVTTPPQTYSHVIWIWMENRSYETVIGAPGSAVAAAAPYINGTLAAGCGLAKNFHNITHPSLPNYIAATSGSTNGINTDCSPTSCTTGAASIFSQVRATGGTWRSYSESMPANCYLSTAYPYAPKHNPAPYYTAIRDDCLRWSVPLGTADAGALLGDLQADALPTFSFVTPDECNDMHDCSTTTGDNWLRAWVPLITASRAYQSGNTAVVITWDEGEGGSKTSGENCATNTTDISCHIATLVLSPSTPRGITSSTLFNHYSMLKTTEEMLGIDTYLGHAGDAATASMRSAFHL